MTICSDIYFEVDNHEGLVEFSDDRIVVLALKLHISTSIKEPSNGFTDSSLIFLPYRKL